FCEDRSTMVASPDYLARHGRPETPADLSGHQVIGYAHVANSALWHFQKGGRKIVPELSLRLSLNNGEAIRDMAVAGLGIARLPGFIIARALREGQLVSILEDYQPRPLPVMAVWPPVSPLPAKLRALIDHLAAELAGGAPWAQGAGTP
ncbi:MAG: substrate binding domain-containing protein, partial [Paracoccus sp. (in: a-proteobacteria)]|nr:substrate binding domain-containing protein [Paracoccus sp. (in: a-proteobacteria)]